MKEYVVDTTKPWFAIKEEWEISSLINELANCEDHFSCLEEASMSFLSHVEFIHYYWEQ